MASPPPVNPLAQQVDSHSEYTGNLTCDAVACGSGYVLAGGVCAPCPSGWFCSGYVCGSTGFFLPLFKGPLRRDLRF